jgi:hypothetical protein
LVLNFPKFLIVRPSKAHQWLPAPRLAPDLRVGIQNRLAPHRARLFENARGGGVAASSLTMTALRA